MNKQQEALKLALEALEETLRTLDDENAKPGGAISDTIWYSEHETLFDYIAAQITAIREALAEQPAQQEPVALDVTIEGDSAKLLASMLEPVLEDEPTPIRLLVGNGHSGHGLYVAAAEYQEEGAVLLVNTSPPASKPWVGLTDETIIKIGNNCRLKAKPTSTGIIIHPDGMKEFGRAVEAKLREKNA